MIFSLPLIGKIGAALFASDATASPTTAQNTIQQNLQAGVDNAVNPASFTQTLSAVDQTATSKTTLSTAKL
jgi:hypothetical protein